MARSSMIPVALVLAALLFAPAGPARANPAAEAAEAGLAPLGEQPQLPNPYRGQASAIRLGAQVYARHCAQCHGEPGEASAEGPDLRRLNGFCRRLTHGPLQAHCLRDVDAYFLRSVLEGKRRAGLMHMPAWRGLLTQESIWALRSYTESLPPPTPRLLPDLPPVTP